MDIRGGIQEVEGDYPERKSEGRQLTHWNLEVSGRFLEHFIWFTTSHCAG
jgi:hypothetical protein